MTAFAFKICFIFNYIYNVYVQEVYAHVYRCHSGQRGKIPLELEL